MGIIIRYYQLQRYKKDYYVPNKNELKKLKSLIILSLLLKSKELPSLKRDGSSCLERILGGNHQFTRAKIIAVGQCTDAAIDGFHIILLVEKVSKLCRLSLIHI